MTKTNTIINENIILLIIGIILSWGIASYWYIISNALIGLFGMENGETISNQQNVKGILFLINTIALILITFKVFQSKRSNVIFKIISIITLIIWFGIIFVHKAAGGIIF